MTPAGIEGMVMLENPGGTAGTVLLEMPGAEVTGGTTLLETPGRTCWRRPPGVADVRGWVNLP